MVSRGRWALPLVLLSLPVVVACGSDSEAPRAAESMEWPATERAGQLGITSWALVAGEDGGTELFGLRDAPEARIVRLHAKLRRADKGRFSIDVDAPSVWHFEYVPGNLPTTSGALPGALAKALALSALDAPDSASSTLPQPQPSTVAPRQGNPLVSGDASTLIEATACLIERPANLVLGSPEHRELIGQTFSILEQFEACRRDSGGVPDPTDPAEKEAYDRCSKAVTDAGCNPESLYLPILDGVASGLAKTTGTGTSGGDSDYGGCKYESEAMTAPSGAVRCAATQIFVTECSTRYACSAVGGEFTADPTCSGHRVECVL